MIFVIPMINNSNKVSNENETLKKSLQLACVKLFEIKDQIEYLAIRMVEA